MTSVAVAYLSHFSATIATMIRSAAILALTLSSVVAWTPETATRRQALSNLATAAASAAAVVAAPSAATAIDACNPGSNNCVSLFRCTFMLFAFHNWQLLTWPRIHLFHHLDFMTLSTIGSGEMDSAQRHVQGRRRQGRPRGAQCLPAVRTGGRQGGWRRLGHRQG